MSEEVSVQVQIQLCLPHNPLSRQQPQPQPQSQPQPQPQPPTASMPQPSSQSSNSGSEHLLYKNRLQEYTEKSSLQRPVYTIINEGAQHAPKFRATVLIDGTHYTSKKTFPRRKIAEQDVARIALQNIPQKMKDNGGPIIRDVSFNIPSTSIPII